jgi:hypothetical protein
MKLEEVVWLRTRSVGWMFLGALGLLSLTASACSFQFSYASIQAPIGTVGEVGIQVRKTHNNCVLHSMDEYTIEGTGIQILGETAWEDKGGGLYEKWIRVSLSELGDGSLKISKTCTKEGYEEKVLPIVTVVSESSDEVWARAWNGTYPFDEAGDIRSVLGSPVIENGVLVVGEIAVPISSSFQFPEILPDTVRLFALYSEGEALPLLLVGEDVFFRFDHLL